MPFYNPYRERSRLLGLTLLSFLTLFLVGALLAGCKAKPAAPTKPVAARVDPARTVLVQKADSAGRAYQQLHQSNQPNLKSYEDALRTFDSIPLELH